MKHIYIMIFCSCLIGQLWGNIDVGNGGYDYNSSSDKTVSGWTFEAGYTETTENEFPLGNPDYQFLMYYPENGDYNNADSTIAYLREYFYEPANLASEDGSETGPIIEDGADYALKLTSSEFSINESGLYSIDMNLWTIGPASESDYFKAILENTVDSTQVVYDIWDNHIENETDVVLQYTGNLFTTTLANVEAGTYTLSLVLMADNQLEDESTVGFDNVGVKKYEPSDPPTVVPTPSALLLGLSGLALLKRKHY